MRVLMIHNYYQVRGGEDESFESEVLTLREHGHEVLMLTEHNERVSALGRPRTAMRTVWSSESHRQVQAALRAHRADICHVQNSFPLFSPAVYYAAQTEGVPVVQHLRNYRLLCLNAVLHRDGHVCEDCIGNTPPWPGVIHACYRDSRFGSAVVAGMLTSHRLARSWTRKVDVFVALTEFMRGKLIEGGLPEERTVIKPNFVSPDPGLGIDWNARRGAIFVGRLTEEKGILTLLQAWARVDDLFSLRIVGEGPLQAEVEAAATHLSNVEYLGHQPIAETYRLMGEAAVLVLPSEWYEPFGRVAVEAFAKGTPVLGARIGGIPELVRDGETGWLFKPGDADDLAAKLRWTWAHRDDARDFSKAARQEYEVKYTSETNYQLLMQIYEQAIERRVARKDRHSDR